MTSEKSYTLEGRVNTQVAEGWSIPFEAIKPTSEGRTATALANDSDLIFTGVPAGTYKADLDAFYDGGTGASESDLKFTWTIPTGTLNMQGTIHLASDGGALHLVSSDDTASITAWTNGTGTMVVMSLTGSLVSTAAGTFAFRWACGANTGTNTHLLAGSRLSLSRRI